MIEHCLTCGCTHNNEFSCPASAFVHVTCKDCGNDFLYYFEDSWMALTKEEKVILVDHELRHLAMDGTPYLRDHDVEEFLYIVDKYDLKSPNFNWGSNALKRVLAERERDE